MLSVLPVKSQWENGPLQGRTSQVAGVLRAGGPGTARTCVRRAEISGRADHFRGEPVTWQVACTRQSDGPSAQG
jgi:hypothetical protein